MTTPTTGPGEQESPLFYDLTETEAAVIEALREGRQREGSWKAYYLHQAWELIHHLTEYADEPAKIADCTRDEEESGLLLAAATANAEAIAFLMNRWTGGQTQ